VPDAKLAYHYRQPSAVRDTAEGAEVLLATSGGVTAAGPAAHPYFFSGFLTDPAPAATGMLACAAVARARYYTPMAARLAAMRDPVVTCNADRLRFESFSSCCGVHARLDLLPAALDGAPAASGTTNVDFGAGMRAALAGLASGGPLLLSVGSGEVAVDTAAGLVTERKVPLPGRWVKGLGEVQALTAGMRPLASLTATAARRFLRSIPRTARRPLWAMPARDGLAPVAAPRPGAACVAGPARLAELGPLLRFARCLRVYGPAAGPGSLPVPSSWELDLGTARFTFTLSPESSRGFSGEGALLNLLADEDAAADAEAAGQSLTWDPRIDPGALAAAAGGLPAARVTAALGYLAASGRVGYDLAEESFFHRELPFGAALDAMNPRLASARQLITDGAVTLAPGGAAVAGHRVTLGPPDRCTCPWWGRHQGTRGPCKHVLAARMAAR
jgi:hypothetical protein